jgi:peptide/nickel transport system ATP-binding protein
MTSDTIPTGDGRGAPLLSVRNLGVAFPNRPAPVVRGVSFDVAAGECLAIVGESGSGKSVTARALLGLVGDGALVTADRLDLDGRALRDATPSDWRRLRGGQIGLVLQDALVSLDPLRPIGREIDDSLRLHTTLTPRQRRARVIELLESVGMPQPEQRARQRSGELSGGLRQRALIASAIATNPGLLIADEPTTALDVTVQAQVLDLLGELKASGTAILLISHDLAVVAQVADRIAVMKAGQIVELGVAAEVLSAPANPYTIELLGSVPSSKPRGERLTTTPPRRRNLTVAERPAASTAHRQPAEAPTAVLEAHGLVKTFSRGPHRFRAVDGVSFTLDPGTTLGLVGESGSGKTTVARIALGLTTPDNGSVLLDGEPWTGVAERQRRSRRHSIGAVYQDALSSFDPRLTVGDILLDAVDGGRRSLDRATRTTHDGRIAELLDSVGLADAVRHRRPLHLSGGQRQRVSIARALAPSPRVIICDEPVSALDVSVQAQVLDLLDELQRSLGLAYLFISHDLGVVQHMSDAVAVMREGRIVETGTSRRLFASPRHEYTQQLLAAAPRLHQDPPEGGS